MEFKKEAFEGENVSVNLTFTVKNDVRKIVSLITFHDRENRLLVKLASNGGFWI